VNASTIFDNTMTNGGSDNNNKSGVAVTVFSPRLLLRSGEVNCVYPRPSWLAGWDAGWLSVDNHPSPYLLRLDVPVRPSVRPYTSLLSFFPNPPPCLLLVCSRLMEREKLYALYPLLQVRPSVPASQAIIFVLPY